MRKNIVLGLFLSCLFLIPTKTVYAQGQLELRQHQWVYVENKQIQTTFTGLVQHQTNKGWFYVKNGKIDWKFTGLAQHQTNKGWFYVKNGKVDWEFTGLAQHQTNKGWFYVKNGKVDWKFTGLAQHQTNKGWFYVKNGKVDWKFTGLVQHQTNKKRFYVRKGKIDWQFTDVVIHSDGKQYYVQNGKLANGKLNRTEIRKVSVAFSQVQHNLETVPKGMTEIITHGKNGINEEVYTVTYVDGIKKSETKTSSRVIEKPISQTKVVGTGDQTYKVGYDWETGKYIAQKETDASKDTIAEVQETALSKEYILYLRDYRTGTLMPVYDAKQMREIVNKYFDVKLYNDEFLKLINAHRKAHGKEPLQLDALAIKAAMIRSIEQAEIANLRSQGKPHTRPDGTSWDTVKNDIPEYKNGNVFFSGENILARGETELDYLVDEKGLAEKTFEQWKNSPGHNAAMLSSFHTHFGVGAGFTLTQVGPSEFTSYPYPIIATTIFAKK